MTAPETDPCGCPIGDGHTCRPVWMDEAEWPETRKNED